MQISQTLVQRYERVIRGVVERMVARYEELLEEIGDKPFGFIPGTKFERLAVYIDQMRELPAAWQQAVDYYTFLYGNRATAITQVYKEATAMERSLALEGGWDRTPEDYHRAAQAGAQRVRAQQFASSISAAEKAMRQVEKAEALPKPLIGPIIAPEPVPVWALQPSPLPQPVWPGMGESAVQQMPAPPMGVLQ